MSSTTSSDPTAARLHVAAALAMLAAGSLLPLLGEAVLATGPLTALGWWTGAAGLAWVLLAPPTVTTMRDSVLPGAFLALGLGLAGYALELGETVLVAGFLVAPLSVGPAVAGLIRRTMPAPFHLVGFAAGALAVIVVGSRFGTEPAVLLAVVAGVSFTVVHLTMSRTLHSHRVIAHGGGVLTISSLLLLSGATASGGVVPTGDAWLALAGATILGAVVIPLVRVRLAERLTPGGIRPHLPLLPAGAALLVGVPSDLTTVAAVALLIMGAWTAGLRPSELTGAEAYRPGP